MKVKLCQVVVCRSTDIDFEAWDIAPWTGGTALAARYFGALREAEVRFAALSARSFCSD